MSADAYFDPGITMQQYLADRGRLSGHVLTMVDERPEDFGRWRKSKLRDEGSPGLNQGSYLHAKLLEPHRIHEHFAFYPNRAEAPDKDGEPQDPSPEGLRKSMMTNNKRAKAYLADFIAAHKSLTFVYPESQPLVNAMVKAVERHPEAAALLHPDGDFAPEVTGHWTCPETGEPLQIRPDAIRLQARQWIEIKSYTPKGDRDRLDTLDPGAVVRWAREGWARKSAMLHDGCRAITGDEWTGYWIVVEAVEHEPRVSVVRDAVEAVPCLYQLGRDGYGDIRGYIELIRLAQFMREEGDYRAACTREVVKAWPLPEWLEQSLLLERKPPPIKGVRKMEAAPEEPAAPAWNPGFEGGPFNG